MKALSRSIHFLCVLLFSFYQCYAAPAATNESGFQLTIDLRDGSRVNGKILQDIAKFHSGVLGDVKLAWAEIRSIKYQTETTARLTITNGDELTGTLTAESLRIQASFGRTDLPVKLIRSIHVSTMPHVGQLPPGLVSYWSGDGDATDKIGGNNGTVTSSVTFGLGKLDQGFVFDGKNGSGVTLGNPISLRLQDFTIEMWLKRGNDRVASYGTAGNANLFDSGWGGYLLGMSANGQLFFDRLGDVEPQRGPFITDTAFHHVAVTKKGSEVVFYLDGKAYPVPCYMTAFTFTGTIGFGYHPDNAGQSFLGILDEIGVFNRALSPDEIQTIYTSQQ